MKTRITLFLLFTLTLAANAQDKSFKFGKVDESEVKQKEHPIEKDAEAAILYKKERVYYNYNNSEGFQTVRDVHIRVKIYSKSGLDWGTLEVPLYKSKNGEERISSIKGYSFNLENGKLVSVKLKKDGIFSENVSKYRNKTSIAMPEIKEGTVIDVEYKITSDFAGNIDDFKFQYGIPLNKVEVTLEIPEYFVFKRYARGYYPISLKESRKKRQIEYSYKPDFEAGFGAKGRSSYERRKLDFFENVYAVNAQNIPSLKEVDYTDNINNYRSSIKFELSSTQFPNTPYKYYSRTWENVAKSIYEYNDFGGELKNGRFLEKIVQDISGDAKDNNLLMKKIYDHVKRHMTWNNYYGVSCENGLKKAYEGKSGNVGDINLMLVAMLRIAGLNANPVLVSTKSRGIPLFPTNEGFNYVVAAVESGGAMHLLDATEKMGTINVLPTRALNWNGRLIKEDGSSKEVNLFPSKKAMRTVMMNASVLENGVLEGKIRTQLTDALAFDYRESHMNETLDDIMDGMEQKYLEMEVDGLELKNQNECDKPIVESCSFVKENQIEMISGKMYFRPALFLAMNDNPFKMEKREYPVDFGYPQSHRIMVNFTMPEGYQVESIPENIALAMPDGLGQFKYSIQNQGKFLQFKCTFEINKAIVAANYYPILKEFYGKLLEKQSERVVLSKI